MMAHKKGHKMKGHTGPIKHGDMPMHIDGHGGKDPHASAEHHAANAEHGMHEGMSPQGGYDGGGEEHGGEGMSGNAEYC